MMIKKVIAKDMQQAMKTIGKEFGDNAVILSKRTVGKKGLFKSLKNADVEVTVAYDPDRKKRDQAIKIVNDIVKEEKAEPKVYENVKVEPKDENIKKAEKAEDSVKEKPIKSQFNIPKRDEFNPDKIEEMRMKMLELNESFKLFSQTAHNTDRKLDTEVSEETAEIFNRLINNGVDYHIAKDIVTDIENASKENDEDKDVILREIMMDILGDPEPIKLKKYKRTIVIFVGPTGVGKTTSLVKLAAHFSNEMNLKVGIINTDTYRVAAQEQLNIYSDILNVPCHVAYSVEDISVGLEKQSDRDLVFIDTAGKSVFDEEYKDTIRQYLNVVNPDEVFLTLPITNGFDVCKSIVKASSYLGDYKLLLTKLDETTKMGNILNISSFARKKLSYVTIGQQVPDDIEIADIERIASEIVKQGDET